MPVIYKSKLQKFFTKSHASKYNFNRGSFVICNVIGDAFLSIWEVKDPTEFPELIQQVADTALYCQEKYGAYVCSDVGITIKGLNYKL